MTSILLVGLNHNTAAIDVREQFSLDGCRLRMALNDLLDGRQAPVQEIVILSTCNRLEVYAVGDEPEAGWQAIRRYLAQMHTGKVTAEQLAGHLYFCSDREAVDHLMRVASGLDSMILGEPQILGQVAHALAEAQAAGTAGPVLSHCFSHAIHCGKRARTDTEIGSYTTSLSHAAAQLAVRELEALPTWHALIVGAGEMAELAALALEQRGNGVITCINRTKARAERLAERVNGHACGWPQLDEALIAADVVLSATSAPHPVIQREDVAAILPQRNGRPLLLIDIALPRDIEIAAGELDGVARYDIDHLRDVVDGNIARRQAAIPLVEEIIAGERDCFLDWLGGRQVVPALVELRNHAESLAEAELERTLRRLRHFEHQDERLEQEITQLAHRIVNKILHEPTVRLKAQAVNGNGAVYAHVLADLFDLKTAGSAALNGRNGSNGHNGAQPHA